MDPLSAPVRTAVGLAALVTLTIAERVRPLRRQTRPANRRLVVNLVVGAIGAAAVAAVYAPCVLGAAGLAEAHRIGVLRWLRTPGAVMPFASIVLLDFTLWVWHLLNHRVGLLWRFHAAHHADLDLDASTAIRFHAGELLFSVPWRMAQVVVLGVPARSLLAWEALLLVATLFHHSNLGLSRDGDRLLRRVIVTPRLHGIHHADVGRLANTNFGTIFTFWDRLLRTYSSTTPQDQLRIGLPGVPPPEWIGISETLALPFRRKAPPLPASVPAGSR